MNQDAFSDYHPVVHLLYFVLVLGLTVVLNHPVCLAISYLCALAYSIRVDGDKVRRMNLVSPLFALPLTVGVNAAFNHQGATILAYLPNGNPLTLESILSGVSSAFLLVAMVTWFHCVHKVMTSEQFTYLLGRAIPSTSLVLMMTLRFAPRFAAQAKAIAHAQKCVGRDVSNGNIRRRIRHGIRILSVLTTWALEHSIDISDSMKSRGYGLPGRTSFSIHHFERRDKGALVFLLLTGGAVVAGVALGELAFAYYPSIGRIAPSIWQTGLFGVYLSLCIFPLYAHVKEVLTWRTLRQASSPKM